MKMTRKNDQIGFELLVQQWNRWMECERLARGVAAENRQLCEENDRLKAELMKLRIQNTTMKGRLTDVVFTTLDRLGIRIT